jgi:ABC-type dipeptide/oligopeptide/nickel transport system permease component
MMSKMIDVQLVWFAAHWHLASINFFFSDTRKKVARIKIRRVLLTYSLSLSSPFATSLFHGIMSFLWYVSSSSECFIFVRVLFFFCLTFTRWWVLLMLLLFFPLLLFVPMYSCTCQREKKKDRPNKMKDVHYYSQAFCTFSTSPCYLISHHNYDVMRRWWWWWWYSRHMCR